MTFKQLHHQPKPLILCNVWDVTSAKIAENLKFQAMGTSSAAIADVLGYQDGEQMPFEELLFMVKRITAATSLPLTVDIEAGFSRNAQVVVEHIKQLVKLGVVGINIEDSLVEQERKLIDAKVFAELLKTIKNQLNQDNVEVFINARTDAILLGVDQALPETIKRIALYQAANIDGVFIPCVTNNDDIKTIVNSTDLAVNVMCMPELPDFSLLQDLGVKRISMGDFIHENTKASLTSQLNQIIKNQSFHSVF